MATRLLHRRAIPLDGESFTNLLNRLALANHFDSISWLGYAFPANELSFRANPNASFAAKEYNLIASISGIPAQVLHNMTIHGFAGQLSIREQLDEGDEYPRISQSEITRFVTTGTTKYCPICLNEKRRYHRIAWDLNLVTTCLHHKVFLLDTCPNCQQRVFIEDIVKGVHGCGFNLSTCKTVTPVDDQLGLASQAFIQGLLGLPVELPAVKDKLLPVDLPAPKIFHLLSLLVQYGKSNKLFDLNLEGLPVNIQHASSNLKHHIAYLAAYKALLDWPNNFENFFMRFGAIGSSDPNKESRLNNATVYRLISGLNDPDYRFVHDSISECMVKRNLGFWHANSLYIRGYAAFKTERQYLPMEEAGPMLGIGRRHVIQLINDEILKVVITEQYGFSLKYIDVYDINVLREKWKGYFTYGQVKARLGVKLDEITELANSGYLPAHFLEKASIRFFSQADVETFEQQYMGRGTPVDTTKNDSMWLSMKETINILRLGRQGLSKVLNLVGKGILNTGILTEEKGFARLVFHRQEVFEIRDFLYDLKRKVSDADYSVRIVIDRNVAGSAWITIHGVAQIIGVADRVVERWAKEGLFDLEKGPEIENGLRISLVSYIRFRKIFVYAEEAAKLLGVTKRTLLRWVHKRRVDGVVGLTLDGGRRYLFDQSQIKKLLPEKRMTISAAASRANVGAGVITRLIARGKITVVSGMGKDDMKHALVDADDIVNISAIRNSTIQLPELAEKLGIAEYKLRVLAKQKIVPAYSGPDIDGFPVYCFSYEEVEPFLREYASEEVAKRLNISEQAVRLWTQKGKIRAFSGPGIDGKKKYRYRLLDIMAVNNDATDALLSIAAAANELGISVGKLWLYVKAGKVTPCRGPSMDGSKKYYFYRDTILRVKNLLDSGLLSAKEAAKALGEDLSWFYKKWVNTGRIKTINAKDKLGKHFFRKEDIMKAVQMRKETVTGPEAAKLIGVRRGTILKWMYAGKLKPIAGPDIDGFGCYLYLLSDVKKIRKDRERQNVG